MKKIICFFISFIYFSLVFASDSTIEIDANGKKLTIPFWASMGTKDQGSLLMIFGDSPKDTSFDLLPHLAIHFAKIGWSVAVMTTDGQNWTESLPDVMTAMRKKNASRLVILHYGDQLKPLMDYLSQPQSKGINGLILLSAFNAPKPIDTKAEIAVDDTEKTGASRKKISFPIIDVTAQFDYQSVIDQEKQRKIENVKNKGYQRLKLSGAAHDYDYAHHILVARLQGWMLRLQQRSMAKPPISTSGR